MSKKIPNFDFNEMKDDPVILKFEETVMKKLSQKSEQKKVIKK